jgi:hypothetical protein
MRKSPSVAPVAAKKTRTAKPKTAVAKPAEKKKRVSRAKSGAPKRPLTAFFLFMGENRDMIKKNNPTAAFTEIPKIGAQEWAKVKPSVKAKYETMAQKDRERYAKQMESYVPSPEDKKVSRKKKDPNAPKRAKSGFIFFVEQRNGRVRKEHPEFKMTEVMKHLGGEWKSMDDRAKQPFVTLAEKDKVRYSKEIAARS